MEKRVVEKIRQELIDNMEQEELELTFSEFADWLLVDGGDWCGLVDINEENIENIYYELFSGGIFKGGVK